MASRRSSFENDPVFSSTPRKRSHDMTIEPGPGTQSSSPTSQGTQRGIHVASPTRTDRQSDQLEDDEFDPDEPLPGLDWTELETRYHQAMEKHNQEERKLLQDFDALTKYFQVWSRTTTHYETDRSFARFKTRVAFTKHTEEEGEQKRQHYQKVVQALQTAMDVLVQDDSSEYQRPPRFASRVSMTVNFATSLTDLFPRHSPHPARCAIL